MDGIKGESRKKPGMRQLGPCIERLRSVSVHHLHTRVQFRCSSTGPSIAMTQDHTAPRGALIVLEGADRAGKTTQCKMLVDFLNAHGMATEFWRFPDRTTTIGKMIDSYLGNQTEIDDAAVHLLFSANRWEKREALISKLGQGINLVVDRYAYSGVAFTAAKQVQGLDIKWCQSPDEGLPAPDAVFFLHLSAEAAAKRGGFGGERYERPAFQERVLQQFESMRQPDWKWVDADKSIDEIQEELRASATKVIQLCGKGGVPLKTLWQ